MEEFKMKNLFRKALVMLKSLIMTAALLPMFYTPAQAENFTANNWSTLQTAMAAALAHVDPASTITITGQIVPGAGNHILDGGTKTITLLRGWAPYLFYIGNNVNLVLNNIIIDGNRSGGYSGGTRLIIIAQESGTTTVTMNSGAILQNNDGGAVIINAGTFNMNGGEIRDNYTSVMNYGAGVRNSGTFNMSGGTIEGNYANNLNGGGVFNEGTFNMTGGFIQSNRGARGSNIYNEGAFTMTDGYVMSGRSTGSGGEGIYQSPSLGSITLGGSARIPVGNWDNGWNQVPSVRLGAGSYITLGTGPDAPVLGGYATGMSVAVYKTDNNYVFVNSGASADHAGCFDSNISDRFVYYESGQLMLAVPSVAVAAQTGSIIEGTGGTATFNITTNLTGTGAVSWHNADESPASAPTGITPSVTAAAVTMTGSGAAVEGTYYFKLTINGTTSSLVTLTVWSVPDFTLHPANETVTAGQNVTFTVTASGFPAPTLQWQINTGGGWGNITGETTASLTITGVALGDDGNQYQCVATNSAGTATSNAATLTVITVPGITLQPLGQSVTAGQSATFTVTASGIPAPSFQWQENTGGGWGDITGATTSTLTLTAVTLADDGNEYRCVATNGAGSATSNAATLTVTAAVCEIVHTNSTTTPYSSIGTAFAAVASGETVRLLANISNHPNVIQVNGISVTLETNGFTLGVNTTDMYALNVISGGSLLLDDSGGGAFNVVTTNTGASAAGVFVTGGGTATVTNATATGSSGSGAGISNGGSVTVTGNAQGVLYGVTVVNGGTLTVGGNVTADAGTGTGAVVSTSGTITVEGAITAADYISLDGTVTTAAQFATPTTNQGYLTYNSGSSTVWVKSADVTAPALTAGAVARSSDADATVRFTGNEAGMYYWQLDGTAPTAASLVAAATNATALTAAEQTVTLATLATGAHTIYIVAEDASGNVSNLLTISIPVYVPPSITITAQPAATTVVGEGVITESLSVTASVTDGSTLSYEWFSNATNANTGGTTTGVTAATFPIPTTLTAGGSPYYYYCVVTSAGSAPAVNTDVATVTVTPAYAVTFSVVGGNGLLGAQVDAVTIVSGAMVLAGKSVVFTATPDAGYRVREWTLDGSTLSGVTTNGYTLTAVTAAHTVTVEFERDPSTFVPPQITGPTAMSLTTGYASTSTTAYTVTGDPAPTVTKTSGNPAITWNNATRCLDIASGLTAGVYPVVLEASNGALPNANLTFTLTVADPVSYAVSIAAAVGGSVSADKSSAFPGETVTLTITPNAGYELLSLRIYLTSSPGETIPLSGSSSGTNGVELRSFTMPAGNVSVSASFHDPAYQAAWEAAKAIIEAATFELPQDEATTQANLRYRLAELINELLKNNSTFSILHSTFSISPSDIVIFDYNFRSATAGDAQNRSGTNGYFEFRVTPPNTRASAYNSGVIVATSYNDVANEQLTINNEQLKVWVQNGILYVSGLTPGEQWGVYNLTGILVYTGAASGDKAEIPLPGRDVYIVYTATGAMKVVN